ncbi:MAG: hypothetical protein IJZ95_02520 [Oscillospiraceae bacterium]|nr:hypothetical protein [Oscillospiraceae bacterium]
MVSVYISNEKIQAAYGVTAGRSTEIEKVITIPIARGTVLNGTVIGREELSSALIVLAKEIEAPINKVRLIISGAVTRYVTVPDVRKPAYRRALLEQEFKGGSGSSLYAGQILGYCSDSRAEMLACMAERELVEGYVRLLSEAGFGVSSIELSECAAIRLVSQCGMLCGSSFVLSALDGSTAVQFVFADGECRYTERRRLYSERCTEAFSDEIRRSVKELAESAKEEQKLSGAVNVLLCGYSDDELAFLRSSFSDEELRIAEVPEQDEIKLPYSEKLSECIFAAGGLMPADKGDIDLLAELKRDNSYHFRADGHTLRRNAVIVFAVIMAVAVTACITALNIHKNTLREELAELVERADAPAYDVAAIEEENALLHDTAAMLADVSELCNENGFALYKDDMFLRLNKLCGSNIRLTEIRGNGLEIMLGFEADDAAAVPLFVQRLIGADAFGSVSYSGYSKENGIYKFTLECKLDDGAEVDRDD